MRDPNFFRDELKIMSTRLKERSRQAIDQLISQGVQPKAARNGIGLVLQAPGARAITLFNQRGLTSSGRHYYQAKNQTAPTTFDFEQDPLKKGASYYITLLDGTKKKISTWDSLNRKWRLTQLGKTFYSKSVDKFIVQWPVRILLTRINGSIFEREDYLASTATSLGEIEVSKALLPEAQVAKVREIEQNWRQANGQLIDEQQFLVSEYEAAYLDTERPIEYDKQSMSVSGDFETTLNRPLREGKPFAFHGLDGVSEDAYEPTEGQCVSYQLSKHIKIKGKDAPYTQEQIVQMLI